MVDPVRCAHLDEAFKECPLKSFGGGRRLPSGRYAHATDAAGYALWWLEPRPRPQVTVPSRDSMRAINLRPTGPRIL